MHMVSDSTLRAPLADIWEAHPLLSCAASLILALCTYVAYNAVFHPLAGLPGPLQAKLGLGSWMTVRALKWDFQWKLKELHDKHGKVIRVARNQVSVSDPACVKEIFGYAAALDKSTFYNHFAAEDKNVMAILDHRSHAAMRKSLAPAFSMNYLTELEPYVDTCTTEMLEMIDRKMKKGGGKGSVEMATALQWFTMDVIGELGFGQTFGMCKTESDPEGYLPMAEAFNASACLAGTQPWFAGPLLAWGFRKIGAAGPIFLENKTKAVVDQRTKALESTDSDDGRRDLLNKFITAKHPNGGTLSSKDVVTISVALLGAGSDSTAITLRALLRYVVGDPRIYKKVMQEVTEAFDDGTLEMPVKYAQGVKLPYMQACIKETLRFYPSVGWLLPRVVPKGGAVFAGRFLPEGTQVSMSPYVLHHSTAAYGPDAEEFRPERWIEAGDEQRRDMENYLITFGTGTRVCVGKSISMMEMIKAAPVLFHKYNMSFTPRGKDGPHLEPGRRLDGVYDAKEPWHTTSQWFSHQTDFWMDFTARSSA